MSERLSSKGKEKLWDIIINHPDFVKAEDYNSEECCAPHCHERAVGEIYFWCGDPECCHPPSAFLCKKHLIQEYPDLQDNV